MAKAYLMNKNTPLMSVEAERGKIKKIKEIKKENISFFPIRLQNEKNITLANVNVWLNTRKIPEKREGLSEARTHFRGFENYRNMFSLTDQYWLKYTKQESWSNLNFFTNQYDQNKGLIFFEPWRADETLAVMKQTPDLTTNGVLRKRWIQDEYKNSYLIKAGSKVQHQEPLSEVLASLVLRDLDIIDFVEYELIIYGLQFCSKCANFITADTDFVPASDLYLLEPKAEGVSDSAHFLKMCERYGVKGVPEYLEKISAVDHILCNTDRHFGNFGFIRNANTGEILGFAPLFDFGRAYWGFEETVQEKTSKYFKDIELEAFRKIIRDLGPKKLPPLKNLKQMVERYPELSDSQVKIITAKIDHVINELDVEFAKGRKEGNKEISR